MRELAWARGKVPPDPITDYRAVGLMANAFDDHDHISRFKQVCVGKVRMNREEGLKFITDLPCVEVTRPC